MWTGCDRRSTPPVEHLRDVNEQLTLTALQAQEQAEDLAARYRDLVEGLDAIVWEADVEVDATPWRFTFVSPQAVSLLGYPVERWLKETNLWIEMMHADDRPEVVSACRSAAAARRDVRVEYRAVTSTGQVVWVALIARVRRRPHGATQVRGVLLDITALKRTEKLQQLVRDLQTSQDQLKEKNEALAQGAAALRDKQAQLVQSAKLAGIGELAAGIAHELNNPLNNIGLCIGNVLDGAQYKHDEYLTARLRTVNEQVSRAAAIIHHLQTFARATPTERRLVLLSEVVQQALLFVTELLRLDNVAVQTELCRIEAPLWANAVQLEQVIINLLTNARDALDGHAKKAVTVRTSVAAGVVTLVVEDNGPGISTEVVARIFDPFFTTKPVGKGTGLGLSITYGIVKDHGGSIHLEKGEAGGARFVIRLPLAQGEQAAPFL
ncbi:MAG: ATP-binding protein [Nitrospirota bacterium]|nr:ATP-binding protein [Nitrospirota bacterium]